MELSTLQKQHWRHHHHQRNQQQQQQQQQQEKHQQQQQLKTFTRAVLSLEKRANARIRGRKNRLERFYTKILLIKRPSLLDLAQFGTNFYMIFVSSSVSDKYAALRRLESATFKIVKRKKF